MTAKNDAKEVAECMAFGRRGVAMVDVFCINSGERIGKITRYFWTQIVVGAKQGKI